MDTAPGSGNELSEKQLKWGFWWLNNKKKIKTVFTVILGVVAFSFFAYGTWGFADWFFGSGVRERAETALLTQNLTDYEFFRESARPLPIVTQPAQVIPAGDGKYDIIAKLVNPNHRWWLEFDYQFTGSGFETPIRQGFILPTDTKFAYSLAIETERRPSVSLEMSNIKWHRVDGHIVKPNYEVWGQERLNIVMSDIEFVKPDPTATVPVSRAVFSVSNRTAFGYVGMPFFITLYNGNTIVGVNRVVSTQFRSGETRKVEASWFNDLPSVTKVEVKPEINIFDSNVYLRPSE